MFSFSISVTVFIGVPAFQAMDWFEVSNSVGDLFTLQPDDDEIAAPVEFDFEGPEINVIVKFSAATGNLRIRISTA